MTDYLQQQRERDRQMYAHLAECPLVELTGVVTSVGGCKSYGEVQSSLLVTVYAWRIGDGPVQTEGLTVRRRDYRKEHRQWLATIPRDKVVRMRVRVAEPGKFPARQALLEEFVAVDESDAELHERLREYHTPMEYQDAFFGALVGNRRFMTYTASVTWGDLAIELELGAYREGNLESALQAARTLWDSQPSWDARIRDYAVEQLLPVKNEHWLDPDTGDEEVSAEQFRSRMTLMSLSVEPDGRFSFWHDDGELFFGHSIVVYGNLSDGPTDADIPG